ncbi:helix-turn-helix transcriptional regulator [Exiguobacterium sp. SH3S1]|uniref:helix-turn-helix domain-containing protein n=1 Tax=Exiguobacterium sp. SH3S1 TaxID=2510955 RepID=UPI00103E4083|nr:helix-turn-helix transcriptional regulator [Exiguobacterium sp. SH3S1]TCI61812.1 XRE family transcriptional regulator [Exiguobacterium sp. SH3S1]
MANKFLIELGIHLPEIRNQFSLTQEEFSSLLGMSRPTLIKIEQDPTRLTKTIAMTLYVAVQYLIEKDKVVLNNLNPNNFDKVDSVPQLLQIITSKTSISPSSILGGTISVLGSKVLSNVSMSSIGSFLGKIKKKSSTEDSDALEHLPLKNELQKSIDFEALSKVWDNKAASDLIENNLNAVNKKEKNCLQFFNLESWNVIEFMNQLEES